MADITVALTDDALDALADRVAMRLAPLLRGQPERGGFLRPEGAASYLGVNRKRIYDLKSMGALVPDGYDGRTPLFKSESLDAYAKSGRVAP